MQKKAIFTLLFFLTTFFGFAQENKSSLINAKIKDGTILIGGTLGGSYQRYGRDNLKTGVKETGGHLITARLVGKSGYFFLPDFAAGLNVSVDHTSISIDSTLYGKKTTYLLAGPFVRYYADNGIFGELTVNAGVNVIRGAEKTDIKGAAIGIGYAYFLNPVVSIEPLLTVNYLQNRTDDQNQNTKDVQFGPVLNIGIQAYIYRPTRVLPTK